MFFIHDFLFLLVFVSVDSLWYYCMCFIILTYNASLKLASSLSGTPFFKIYFQWKKAEEKLERELREAEASESTEKKLKLVGSFTHSLMLLKLLLSDLKLETYCFNLWLYDFGLLHGAWVYDMQEMLIWVMMVVLGNSSMCIFICFVQTLKAE